MEAPTPRYADHRIDGYTFYLDLDENELVIELSNEPPNPPYNRCPLVLTIADARALRAFLSLPDVAAVLLAAEREHQERKRLFHADPANH